jgi:hypothetical protein
MLSMPWVQWVHGRYIISSLIYLAAVASIDSKLIVDALIPLATVFAYATIVIYRLKAMEYIAKYCPKWMENVPKKTSLV